MYSNTLWNKGFPNKQQKGSLYNNFIFLFLYLKIVSFTFVSLIIPRN